MGVYVKIAPSFYIGVITLKKITLHCIHGVKLNLQEHRAS